MRLRELWPSDDFLVLEEIHSYTQYISHQELGGNSFMGMKLIGRMRDALGA